MSNRFTQYILIAMALGIVMGTADLQFPARQPGRDRGRRKPDRHAVPAPDQDDHRAAGVCHPGRRHRPYGRRLQARPHLRQDHGLVRQRLLRLAAARPRDGQSAAARRQFPRHAARQGAIDRPAGVGVLDREIPDPSDPDLDRGCDGAERDPADRGIRGVLRRRARRDAGAVEADHGADRRSRPYHAQGHRLRDAVRADRGVGGDHGDGGEERPRRAVEADRVHGRLLSVADDPVGHPDRRRLHRDRAEIQPFAAADPRAADDRVLDRVVRKPPIRRPWRGSTASAPRRGSRPSCCRSAIPSTSTAR